MKTIRISAVIGLALGASLALVGCAADASNDTMASEADVCEEISGEVRGINNAALNTLAGDVTTDAVGVQAYFDGLINRANALPDDAVAPDAIATLADALTAARDYVTGAPVTVPDSEADGVEATVRAGLSSDIAASATTVKNSCSFK